MLRRGSQGYMDFLAQAMIRKFIYLLAANYRINLQGWDMLPTSATIPSCPYGFKHCPVLPELHRLQLECARLLELSHTDPLTGLFNFRYLLAALEREMERTRRNGLPTSLIMIDLDHFKLINDIYGHLAGDAVLREVSRIWGKHLRKFDILCRYGGEEFAVILPGSRLSQAVRVAHRLKAALTEAPLRVGRHPVVITASFGVATYEAQEDLTVEAFLKQADELLLEAKARGRNTVCDLESITTKPSTEVSIAERAALTPTFKNLGKREG